MNLHARSARAKNRLREHALEVVPSSENFQGQSAVLTRCTDENCNWTGWFTHDEIALEGDRR